MPETTFTGPDLTTFLGLDALGLTAVGQLLTSTRAIVECRMPIGFEDPFCRACGAQGVSRGTVARRLAHVPVGWRPTQLVVRLRRFACTHCRRVWRQDTSSLAEPRARLTRSAVEWGLRALALECMSVSRVAAALGISWHTANNAILTSAQATLLDDPHRFDGVEVLGVDEHVWRHTRRGDRYVTVIIDLTPVRDRSGPARLLDVVPGRSKKVLKTWLAARDESWRGRVEVVAMDGFTGFKSAAGEELPQARAVMDPFHVVSLAGDKLDQCRRRVQRTITGRRGRAGDRLYRARRTLLTGAGLLTDAQVGRLETLFADDRHAAVQAAWGVYQRLIQAYRAEEAGLGKYLMQRLISSLRQAVPNGLEEIQTLARTLTERASDILAYFDRPRTSNGPTEAINGRLEHLRGIALGFRNLTHYTIRSLIHTGRLKDHLTATT
ncbi:ISL3 family transposase [Actinomyces oris]|uniref:ISL3 family transposase n=1 Tax=Actinomyces oris TaxID=544580 RepID=UPI0028525885|nr:ISL3 family transposase [Actinomyces oris]